MEGLLLTIMLSFVINDPAPDPQDIHLHFHKGAVGYGETEGLPSSVYSPTHQDNNKEDGEKISYHGNSGRFLEEKRSSPRKDFHPRGYSQGIKSQYIYSTEPSVYTDCDCRGGPGLFGAIPPECCKELLNFGKAKPDGRYYTIWTDAQ
eukprot:TRINITY_DN6490_c0_g1_i2.p1 TRINITY_DN6490_c0_g1~~TRINITY_DN6490_c0_g1_i2.p1  ORF type:complete len:148 (-),score=22.72 TRINITY_DN6490_c0_g1_i2:18-461(-)